MADREGVEDLRRKLATQALVSMCLANFAEHILAAVLRGRTVDDALLSQIREQCLTNVKNSYSTWLPIDEEAKLVGRALELVQQLMDQAIARAKQGDG